MVDENKFWMVLRKTGGSAPQKRHYSFDEACTEAARLAAQVSEEYYVLKVIGSVCTPPLNYVYKAIT